MSIADELRRAIMMSAGAAFGVALVNRLMPPRGPEYKPRVADAQRWRVDLQMRRLRICKCGGCVSANAEVA